MSDHSRYSFKVLISVLCLILGFLMGFLWGRFPPKVLKIQKASYNTHTPSPHMSSMFPHSSRPTGHGGGDLAVVDVFRVLGEMSQNIRTHSFSPLHHFRDFLPSFDRHGAQNIVVIRTGGPSTLYRVDISDGF